MNDRELCEMFGTTLEEVEADVARYEAGDFSDFDFSKVIVGRPLVKDELENITTPVAASRIQAMKVATKKQGITRSEFVRRAIDHELLAMA